MIELGALRRILLLFLVFILQTTWIQSLQIYEIIPNAVVLALVLLALAADSAEVLLLAFFIGLFQDAYLPDNLGLNSLANVLVVMAVGLLRASIVVDNVRVRVAVVAAAVLMHDLIYFIGYSDIDIADVPFFCFRYGLGSAIYTGFIALVVSYALLLRNRLLSN